LDADQYNINKIFHPYNGNDVYIDTVFPQDSSSVFSLFNNIEDFEFASSCDGCNLEVTDSGYRLWRNDETFYQCSSPLDTPIALLPLDPANCDYADSDQYDGWGWNAIAMVGCPPLIDSSLVNDGLIGDSVDNDYTDSVGNSDITAGTVDLNTEVNSSADTNGNENTSNVLEESPTQNDETDTSSISSSNSMSSGGGSLCWQLLVFLLCYRRTVRSRVTKDRKLF